MSYPANDPMDPREREVASDEMWHLCADCNAAGAEFRLKRDRYLCDECAARLHAQEIAVIQELLSAPKEPEPAICEFCTNPMPDTDGHGLGECVPVCDRCDGSGVDPGPRCESCGTTGDTVRTGDDVDLCEKCAKDIAEPESPAEPAQDDEAAIEAWGRSMLVHTVGELESDSTPYFASLVCRRAKKGLEIMRSLASERADLRAFVAEWVDRFGFLAKRNKPDDICAIDEVACIITNDMDGLHTKLAAAKARIDEMRAIAEGWAFFANVPEGGRPSVKAVNQMLAALKHIVELGKGGA